MLDEMYSDPIDCVELNCLMKGKLKNKIAIYGSWHNSLINGKYNCLSDSQPRGEFTTIKDGLPYYAKFKKDGFLRIGISDSHSRPTTIGEKLASISDMYEVIKEEYGEPDVFFTTKDDKAGTLHMHWSFGNREEDLKKFESGTMFDDAEIDHLIVFGRLDKSYGNDEFHEDVGSIIGLPIEMFPLVDDNIEDYVNYKIRLQHEIEKEAGKARLLKK